MTAVDVDVRNNLGVIIDSFSLTEVSPGSWRGFSGCVPTGGGTVDFTATGGDIDDTTAAAALYDCDC